TFKTQDNFLLDAHVVDQDGADLSGAQVFVEVWDVASATVVSLQGFSDDTGIAQLQWRIPRQQAAGSYTARVVDIVKSGYNYNSDSGVTSVGFAIQ
ncbi:MAG: hypothetical protein P8Y93_11465, partial [Acidobacteriota bacterium]